MPDSPPQRLSNVGTGRLVAYGALVGGAAYLLAVVYGPGGTAERLAVAALVGATYVAVVHAIGVLRARRPVE
ncbi:hypothetical protein JCM17823_28540 [Halorubrum gandharaense]